MAVTHVKIDRSQMRGNQLQSLVDRAREVVEMCDREKAIMDTCVDAGDYSVLESVYGVPVGKGQAVYNLLSGARTTIKGANTTAFIDQLG